MRHVQRIAFVVIMFAHVRCRPIHYEQLATVSVPERDRSTTDYASLSTSAIARKNPYDAISNTPRELTKIEIMDLFRVLDMFRQRFNCHNKAKTPPRTIKASTTMYANLIISHRCVSTTITPSTCTDVTRSDSTAVSQTSTTVTQSLSTTVSPSTSTTVTQSTSTTVMPSTSTTIAPSTSTTITQPTSTIVTPCDTTTMTPSVSNTVTPCASITVTPCDTTTTTLCASTTVTPCDTTTATPCASTTTTLCANTTVTPCDTTTTTRSHTTPPERIERQPQAAIKEMPPSGSLAVDSDIQPELNDQIEIYLQQGTIQMRVNAR